MLNWLLSLDIIGGPLPWIVWGLGLLGAVLLLVRRPTVPRVRRTTIGLLTGGLVGYGACALSDALNVFGTPLPPETRWWAAGSFAAIGLAVVNLWDSKLWRKLVAVVSIVLAGLSATIGINAAYGLDTTVGDFLEISTLKTATSFADPLPTHAAETLPLYTSWKPPADMPKHGEVRLLAAGTKIPSSAGFVPRDASIYLPPAALVKDPPALPVVVHMMGLPGSPSPNRLQPVLDQFAAAHDGLAPIVIIADQLGSSEQNPGCVDSKAFGGVSTYFNKDIPDYIRTHLRVLPSSKYWTISGYSNGGACSFLYGAEHPEVWGSFASISGEEWAGMEDPGPVLSRVYGGSREKFDANKPENILLRHPGAYKDHAAVFTVGANDHRYGKHATSGAEHARTAGFVTTLTALPGDGHVGAAFVDGLTEELNVLAPLWGLAP
ncbi:alpha/beta hydrolase-fold protein [Microbacterium sp.]|uniref:alpha/beta hydrolase n=1 Tax=Microbacterium sp. TaxID=51671 RepID=UPI003342D365